MWGGGHLKEGKIQTILKGRGIKDKSRPADYHRKGPKGVTRRRQERLPDNRGAQILHRLPKILRFYLSNCLMISTTQESLPLIASVRWLWKDHMIAAGTFGFPQSRMIKCTVVPVKLYSRDIYCWCGISRLFCCASVSISQFSKKKKRR